MPTPELKEQKIKAHIIKTVEIWYKKKDVLCYLIHLAINSFIIMHSFVPSYSEFLAVCLYIDLALPTTNLRNIDKHLPIV